MLENVFAGGDEIRLSSLKNHFYTAIPMIRAGHHGGAEEAKACTCWIRSRPTAYSIGAAIVILIPVCLLAVHGMDESFQLGWFC